MPRWVNLPNIIFILLLAFAAGLSVWRYHAMPGRVASYLTQDGDEIELRLQAAGYVASGAYGFQIPVSLNGAAGVMYFREELIVEPGDYITGAFSVKPLKRSTQLFKATAKGEIKTEKNPDSRYWAVRLSRKIKDRIHLLFQEDSATLLAGILTGDKSGLSSEVTENLFGSGMSHVAAVSGLHISGLAGFLTLILGPRRKYTVFLVLPIIFIYIAVTGFTPSAIRAGIMQGVFLGGVLLGREYSSFMALFLAFAILCCKNPYMLFEPALQLSFTATLGLLCFASRWHKALMRRVCPSRETHKFLRKIHNFWTSALASSCAALVFSTPVAAYWFDGVSLVSPIANLCLLWLIGIIFIFGVLSVAVSFVFFPAGYFLGQITGGACFLFREGIALFAKVPYSVIFTSQIFLIAWLIFVYGLFLVFLITRQWKQQVCAAICGLALCVVFTVLDDARFRLEITVLDVGQGQCIVLRSVGKTAVIDCGGVGGAASGSRLSRFLKSRNVSDTELLILTHYDRDHVEGVPSFLLNHNAGRILGPRRDDMPDAFKAETLDQEHIYSLGEAQIRLIAASWDKSDGNEAGLVCQVSLGNFSFLVTGDVSQPTERWLLRCFDLPSGGVMVAGHHGSKHSASQELLNALSPKAAVISCGENNIYGFPENEVLARLSESDTAVYRTDRAGNITIRVP
ncbi:MAG: DNA internalization-related competence protein ComEC/Rec2 [Oscillospiraceae bacterium]|nr:DNA internalization-related competence protein ComEC/Rec2 [Oscillospiraceae bacterium]